MLSSASSLVTHRAEYALLLEAFSEATDEGIGLFRSGTFCTSLDVDTPVNRKASTTWSGGEAAMSCGLLVGPLVTWDVVLHRALSRHKDLSTARGAPPDSVRRRCLCTGPHGRPTRARTGRRRVLRCRNQRRPVRSPTAPSRQPSATVATGRRGRGRTW